MNILDRFRYLLERNMAQWWRSRAHFHSLFWDSQIESEKSVLYYYWMHYWIWTVDLEPWKKTVDDFYKWIVLFLMIFASFLFGLHSLYSYFGKELTYRDNFTGIEATFITLFWSLFGLSDYRGVELEQFPLSERVWIISALGTVHFRYRPLLGPSNFSTEHFRMLLKLL